jgi:uncharacterized protein YneF (UPF0154 family)
MISGGSVPMAVDLSSILSAGVLIVFSIASFFIKKQYAEIEEMKLTVSKMEKDNLFIHKDIQDIKDQLKENKSIKEELFSLKVKMEHNPSADKVSKILHQIERLELSEKEVQRKMQIFFAKAEKAGWEFDEKHFGGRV